MFSTEDLKTAIGATVIARRNAAARLREAGNPRNPFRALPGMEQQFFEAAQSVRSYDLEALAHALRDAVPEFSPVEDASGPRPATVVVFPGRRAKAR